MKQSQEGVYLQGGASSSIPEVSLDLIFLFIVHSRNPCRYMNLFGAGIIWGGHYHWQHKSNTDNYNTIWRYIDNGYASNSRRIYKHVVSSSARIDSNVRSYRITLWWNWRAEQYDGPELNMIYVIWRCWIRKFRCTWQCNSWKALVH